MRYKEGDLLEADVDVIVHVANLYHTFGAGIAKAIKEKYPEAYYEDLKTDYGDSSKLGYFSVWKTLNLSVYNLYAMRDFDYINRALSYDYFYDGLCRICFDILNSSILDVKIPTRVGFPKFVGCGLARGKWEIVNSILREVEYFFSGECIEFECWELPNNNLNVVVPNQMAVGVLKGCACGNAIDSIIEYVNAPDCSMPQRERLRNYLNNS